MAEQDFVQGLGRRIRERREALRLTQNALSRKLDVSFQAVSKWERGENAPELELIPVLARLLGVSADWLLGRAEHASLETAPALVGLGRSGIAALVEYCTAREFAPGQTLYGPDPNAVPLLYLLESGEVEILKWNAVGCRPIAAVRSGEFFCDYSFFDGGECISEARGRKAGTVFECDRVAYERFERDHPSLALIVLHNEVRKAVGYFREFE